MDGAGQLSSRMENAVVTKQQYAKRLGVSEKSIQRLVNEKGLPAVRLGNRLRIFTTDADNFIRNKFSTMKKLSLLFALLGLSVSALAQGTINVWPSPDSQLFLRASKIWPPGALANTSIDLLSAAPLISVQTGLCQIVGFSCSTLPSSPGNPFAGTTNFYRFFAALPGWDQSTPLGAQLWVSACSNETPTHVVNFAMRVASVATGGDLSSPLFGPSQYATNSLGQYQLSEASFTLTPGNTSSTNNAAIIEISRVAGDTFTNAAVLSHLVLTFTRTNSLQ